MDTITDTVSPIHIFDLDAKVSELLATVGTPIPCRDRVFRIGNFPLPHPGVCPLTHSTEPRMLRVTVEHHPNRKTYILRGYVYRKDGNFEKHMIFGDFSRADNLCDGARFSAKKLAAVAASIPNSPQLEYMVRSAIVFYMNESAPE